MKTQIYREKNKSPGNSNRVGQYKIVFVYLLIYLFISLNHGEAPDYVKQQTATFSLKGKTVNILSSRAMRCLKGTPLRPCSAEAATDDAQTDGTAAFQQNLVYRLGAGLWA